MTARIVQEVTTPTVLYSGFPSNMGENGVKMTLAVFGEVVDFTAEESDDGMSMGGRVMQHAQDGQARSSPRPAAAHAATHRSRGPPAGLGLPFGPERSALAAWRPKRGCGGALQSLPQVALPRCLLLSRSRTRTWRQPRRPSTNMTVRLRRGPPTLR